MHNLEYSGPGQGLGQFRAQDPRGSEARGRPATYKIPSEQPRDSRQTRTEGGGPDLERLLPGLSRTHGPGSPVGGVSSPPSLDRSPKDPGQPRAHSSPPKQRQRRPGALPAGRAPSAMSPGPSAKARPGWRIASGQCQADPGGYPAVSAPTPSAPLAPEASLPSPPADPGAQAPGPRLRSRHAGPSPWSPRPSDPRRTSPRPHPCPRRGPHSNMDAARRARPAAGQGRAGLCRAGRR